MYVPTYDIFAGRIDDAIWIEAAEGLVNAYEKDGKDSGGKAWVVFRFLRRKPYGLRRYRYLSF